MSDPSSQENSAAPQLTVSQAIANLKQTEDKGDRYYAAWWIGRFKVYEPEAIEALLVALKDEDDRDTDGGFPLRRNAARALGKVGGKVEGKVGNENVVPALIECLSCDDYYVREAAAQSLQSLNEKVAIQPLLNLLEGGVKAAVEVPGKPHLTQPYNAILEALGELGAHELTPIIEPFLQHEVPQVKNGAARAMYQITAQGKYAEVLIQTLACDDLQLRRSALLDLGEVGYLPAADAIANTLAENSIKLISLKGLLEKQLKEQQTTSTPTVSGETRKVMSLMDSLL
ncbi:MAG: HEAT repeat domain-containing protein [Cyanobacteria bacterium J06621_11]